MSTRRPPKLRRQLGHRLKSGRRSGTRWFVELHGRRIHLGSGGDGNTPPPDIQQAYHRTLAEWHAAGERLPAPPDEVTVEELVAEYWTHAKTYYRKDGRPTSTLDLIRSAVRVLVRLYGDTPVQEFGLLRLKAVRDEMIRKGWCRTTINGAVASIKRVFSWGTGASSRGRSGS